MPRKSTIKLTSKQKVFMRSQWYCIKCCETKSTEQLKTNLDKIKFCQVCESPIWKVSYPAIDEPIPFVILSAHDSLAGHLTSIYSALKLDDHEKAYHVFFHLLKNYAKILSISKSNIDSGIKAMDRSAEMFTWRARNLKD